MLGVRLGEDETNAVGYLRRGARRVARTLSSCWGHRARLEYQAGKNCECGRIASPRYGRDGGPEQGVVPQNSHGGTVAPRLFPGIIMLEKAGGILNAGAKPLPSCATRIVPRAPVQYA